MAQTLSRSGEKKKSSALIYYELVFDRLLGLGHEDSIGVTRAATAASAVFSGFCYRIRR